MYNVPYDIYSFLRSGRIPPPFPPLRLKLHTA